jgi:hypothetical protein
MKHTSDRNKTHTTLNLELTPPHSKTLSEGCTPASAAEQGPLQVRKYKVRKYTVIRSKEYMDDDEKQQLEQKVCNSHFADWGLRVPTLEGRQKRHWGVRSSLVSSGHGAP